MTKSLNRDIQKYIVQTVNFPLNSLLFFSSMKQIMHKFFFGFYHSRVKKQRQLLPRAVENHTDDKMFMISKYNQE